MEVREAGGGACGAAAPGEGCATAIKPAALPAIWKNLRRLVCFGIETPVVLDCEYVTMGRQRRTPIMGSTRRTVLAAGVAAAAAAVVPRGFAQQTGKGKFYQKGSVRIYYEEAGSGFPLLMIPGGGLNSTIGFFTGNSPFNAMEEFKGQYRCIAAD